jgi:hypothetical protein
MIPVSPLEQPGLERSSAHWMINLRCASRRTKNNSVHNLENRKEIRLPICQLTPGKPMFGVANMQVPHVCSHNNIPS